MLGISQLLSTVQGKIVAGVLITTLAAGTGVAAVQTAKSFSDGSASRFAASSGSGSADSSASSDEGGTDARGSASTRAVDANASASGSSADRGGNASARDSLRIAGPRGAKVTSGIAVSKPVVGGGGSCCESGGPSILPGGGGSDGDTGSITPPTAPSVPGLPGVPSLTTPTGVAVSESGSYSVIVPATPGDGQKLCLNGTLANRCATVSVPPTRAVTLTISYSGNASVKAPTFAVKPCDRGLEITVAGLTSGSTVTAKAEGVSLAGTLGSKALQQTASFCKA